MTPPFSRHSSVFVFVLAAVAIVRAGDAPSTSLEALVADIVAHHPELKFYEAEIQAARASARTAGSRADPELAVELGRKRVKEPPGTLAGEGTAWSVSVTQTFEWPGRLGLRKAIANRQVDLAELGLSRFRSALDGRARLLAYGLHAANAKAAAVREVANRFSALKATFVAREPAGITPLLETRVIEASELSLQRRASEAEMELQAALIELNQLRGAAAGTPLRVDALELQFGTMPANDALLAAARENNFDLRIRRAELEQQGFEWRLANSDRYPALSVSPYYTQERAGERESTVGVGLSVPLPLSSRARSNVNVADARRRQAEVSAIAAERELEREVLIAAHAFATRTAEANRWAPNSIQRFREAAELADRHYRLGAVPIGTYVELQNSYLDATESLLATRRQALEAGLKLRQLTGIELKAVEVKP